MHLLYAVESCQKIQPHRVTGTMSSRGSPATGGSSSPRGRGSPTANVFERARLTHNLPNDTEEVLRVWVSDCQGRRSLPMAIQDNLRMLLVMGDDCLACHSDDLKDPHYLLTDPDMELRLKSEEERFQSSLKAMSRDEIASALLVDSSKLALNQVPCTSCRKRVNDIMALVITSHPVALHPLVFSKQGSNSERQSDFISVDTHHVALPEALANLFTRRFYFLWQRFEEVHLATRSIRCHLHTRPMKPQPFCSSWLDAWRAMAPDCQAKICSIPYSEVELRLDEFLNRHNFCSECKATVKQACTLLLEKKTQPLLISEKIASDDADDVVDDKEDYCPETYANLIVGRPTWQTASTEDSPEEDDTIYVRVDLTPDEIGRMLELAHLDMYGHKVERHAKTVAVGQREVLSCIGTILYQRFHDASKLVQDYFNNFEALYVLSLKLLKESLEQHFENKFGLKEATLLNELNAEEERNKARAVKKREKKQRQRERQRQIQIQQAKDEGGDHEGEDGQEDDKKSDVTSIATTTSTTDGTASPDSSASIQEQLEDDPEEFQTPEPSQPRQAAPAVPTATPTPSKKASKHAKKNHHSKKSKAPPETKPEPPTEPPIPEPVPEEESPKTEECVPCKLVLRREQPPIPDLFSIIDVWNQSKEVNTMKYMDPKDPRSRGETHSDESEVDENEPEPDPAGEPYIPESEIQSYLDNKKRIDEQRLAIRKKLTMNFNRKFGRNLIIQNGGIPTIPAGSDDL